MSFLLGVMIGALMGIALMALLTFSRQTEDLHNGKTH